MTNRFLIAFDRLMKLEGLYDNNPLDKGGETFMGIARKFHPAWQGWVLVDKGDTTSYELVQLVKQFYLAEFWDKVKGDALNDDDLAYELFEFAVNAGVSAAVQALQHAINLLTGSGVTLDGKFGQKTFAAMSGVKAERIVKVLNLLQGMRYIKIVENDPDQRVFLWGWVDKRVKV